MRGKGKIMRQVEILAPAGSFESMKAAVAAGADGVYIGGNRFGARAYAENLDQERMLEAIDYAHIHGVSLYMTVNTLMKEQELEELPDFLGPYYERGLDGVIVQDLGAVACIRRQFPDLPVHGSTQMTVTGVHGARVLASWGLTRVVTAREMSLEEIRRIHREVPIEIESFVHGALCYCYSGQCLMSSFIGGRSGNRGRCAQPCRLPYQADPGDTGGKGRDKDPYILSMKDLCTLDLLPDLLEAGICSLKIEGRMKSPRYTAGVVRIYRRYVDLCLDKGREGYRVDEADRRELLDLFDRGGFTEGYYRQHNGRDMIARKEKPRFRPANQELFDCIDRLYVETEKKETIEGRLTVKEGEKTVLRLWKPGQSSDGEETVCVTGAPAQTARNQPASREQLEKQVRKTGNTPFVFGDLKVELEGQVFLPVQTVNELRREGLKQLEQSILAPYRRETAGAAVSRETGQAGKKEASGKTAPGLSVLLSDMTGLSRVLSVAEVGEVIMEADGTEPGQWRELADRCHGSGKNCVLAMPVIFRKQGETWFDRWFSLAEEAGFDAFLVRSLDEIGYLKGRNTGIPMYGDHHLYMFNSASGQMLRQLGCERTTLPLELNSRELEGLGGRGSDLIGYGLMPAMVSAQCVLRTVKGCTRIPRWLNMRDRTGKELPVRNHCRYCYNLIYNPSPLSLIDQGDRIRRLAPDQVRLQFTRETKEEVERITRAWVDMLFYDRAGENPAGDFTRGHFKRGVE